MPSPCFRYLHFFTTEAMRPLVDTEKDDNWNAKGATAGGLEVVKTEPLF